MVEMKRDFWEIAISPLRFHVWGCDYDILCNAYWVLGVPVAFRTKVLVMETSQSVC